MVAKKGGKVNMISKAVHQVGCIPKVQLRETPNLIHPHDTQTKAMETDEVQGQKLWFMSRFKKQRGEVTSVKWLK